MSRKPFLRGGPGCSSDSRALPLAGQRQQRTDTGMEGEMSSYSQFPGMLEKGSPSPDLPILAVPWGTLLLGHKHHILNPVLLVLTSVKSSTFMFFSNVSTTSSFLSQLASEK